MDSMKSSRRTPILTFFFHKKLLSNLKRLYSTHRKSCCRSEELDASYINAITFISCGDHDDKVCNDNDVLSIIALTCHVIDLTSRLQLLEIGLQLIKLGRKPNHFISPATAYEALIRSCSKS